MAIPRFNARIAQIQVPSMKNYQEEENASIAKSLADFGSALIGGAIQLDAYARKNKEAEIQYLMKHRSDLIENNASKDKIKEIDERIKALGGVVG